MAEVSKIVLPTGSTYNFKDAQARSDIESIKNIIGSGVIYRGTTTTALTDGATTASYTIDGSTDPRTAVAGDMVSYNNVMYAWNGNQWDELGSAGELKALAYKDSVTGSVTPTGSVSQPSFTGTKKSISVSGTPTGSVGVTAGAPATGETANYTPTGSVSVTPNTASVQQITGVGSLPSLTTTVANETLTIGFSAGSLPTRSAVTVATGVKSASFSGSGTVIKGSFNGNAMVLSGDYTPEGSVSKPSFTGNTSTVTSK